MPASRHSNRMVELVNSASRTIDYTYDNLNRLTQEAINGVGSIGNTYDSVGNRLTRTSGVSAVVPTGARPGIAGHTLMTSDYSIVIGRTSGLLTA